MKPDTFRTFETLVDAIRTAIRQQDLAPLVPGKLLDTLATLAEREDSAAMIEHIQQARQTAQQWQTWLDTLYTQVQTINTQRELSDRYSESWWERQHILLEAAVQDDPQQGLQLWVHLFTDALLDWELEFCDTMAREPFDFPPQALTGIAVELVPGIEALIDERPADALDMFSQLAGSAPLGAPHPLNEGQRALLYVRIGQIYLYHKAQPGAARAQFALAQMLAPGDSRPDAAMGDYHRVQDDIEQAERFYQQAIDERGRDHPEGYVGLGMLAEKRGWWDEAADWFAQAIAAAPDARTIDVAARRVLGFTQAPGSYPERLRYRITGMVADLFGDAPVAAQAYYDAGVRYHWRQESLAAVGLLKRSLERDNASPSTYWQLADALFSASYRSAPPYVEAAAIRESIRVWDAAAERGFTPDAGQAWSYVSRALANEQLDRLSDAPPRTHLWWQSIALCERALLLVGTNSYAWSYLSRFHHNLDHEATALHALDRAFEHAPDASARLGALTEKVTLLANAGYLVEAKAAVDDYLALLDELRTPQDNQTSPAPESQEEEAPPPPAVEAWPADEVWIRGVQAFVLIFSGDYHESLSVLDKLAAADPDNMWNHDVRALCHRKLGHIDEAIADYRWIWERRGDDDYADQRTIIGWSAYVLYLLGAEEAGLLDHAIDILHPLLEKEATAALYRNLGIVYLAKGNITDGEYHLIQGIQRTMNYRELDELRDIDLHDLLHYAAHWHHFPHIRRCVDEVLLPIISERYDRIARKPTALQELWRCRETALHSDPTGGWMWIGAQAGLARLYVETADWDKAAIAYRELRAETGRFPEAVLGLKAVATALSDLGDEQLRAGYCDEARYDFEQALALDAFPDDSLAQAELCCRLGLCRLDMDQEVEARDAFEAALNLFEDGHVQPGDALGETCSALLRDTAHYWKIDAIWEAWGNTGDLPEIDLARARLLDYLNERYQLAAATDDDLHLPIATPIVLELGSALIPEDTGPEWPLLKTYLPAIREQIQQTMGMPVPGVRIRDNTSLLPESYTIQLHEVLVAEGATSAGARFTPASLTELEAAGLHDICFAPATNPVTGAAGCWIAEPDWANVDAAGFQLWDDIDFVVRHLAFVLYHNLDLFLGLQEADELLDTWATDPEIAALINAFLTEPDAQRRFARVLRALVAEGVPITDARAILEAARDAGLPNDDVTPVVRVVRMRLKAQLPGNTPDRRRVELPADLETTLSAYIQHRAGKSFFSLPPETIQAVVQTLNDLIEPDNRDAVLITRSSELRPYVLRLVTGTGFAYVPVLAQDETTGEVSDHA